MTAAMRIGSTCHTAGQLRREAQKRCASMSRDHRANIEQYHFTDGSTITLNGTRRSFSDGQ